jgi:hypothetical protein
MVVDDFEDRQQPFLFEHNLVIREFFSGCNITIAVHSNKPTGP